MGTEGNNLGKAKAECIKASEEADEAVAHFPFCIAAKEAAVIKKCSGRFDDFINYVGEPDKKAVTSVAIPELEKLSKTSGENLKNPILNMVNLMKKLMRAIENAEASGKMEDRQQIDHYKTKLKVAQNTLKVIQKHQQDVVSELTPEEAKKIGLYKKQLKRATKSLGEYQALTTKVKAIDISKAKSESEKLEKRETVKSAKKNVQNNFTLLAGIQI